MRRAKFSFEFSGEELAEAARACVAHHAERLAYWTAEYDAGMAKFKAEGVTINIRPEARGAHVFAAAAPNPNATRMAYQPDTGVVIDQELRQRVEECAAKMRQHEHQQREFARWDGAFGRNAAKLYKLDIDDMNFFWLRGTLVEEAE